MPCRQVFGLSVLPQRYTYRGSANLYMQPFFKYLFGGAIGVIVGVSAYTRIFTEKIPPAGHLGTVQLAFEVDEKTRFQLGVDNLFDRKAPYIQSFTDANTDTMTYDLLGRRFYVGFRTAF